jgi:hypothetical protein
MRALPEWPVLEDGFRGLLSRRPSQQRRTLVAEGLSNREIAHELALSEHTVKKYLFRIFDKLGISTRVELVLTLSTTAIIALQNGCRAQTDATRHLRTRNSTALCLQWIRLPIEPTCLKPRRTRLAVGR